MTKRKITNKIQRLISLALVVVMVFAFVGCGTATEDVNVEVAINANYKGTGGFLGLSDKEKTEKITLILVDEGGEWKVGGYSL